MYTAKLTLYTTAKLILYTYTLTAKLKTLYTAKLRTLYTAKLLQLVYLHVNKAGAGIQVFTDIESLVDILGEDTAGQTVLCHVGSLHDAFHVTSIELAHHLT